MNNDFFEGLSAEHQAIIMEAAAVVEAKLRDAIYDQEAEAIAEVSQKMTAIELTDAERAEWVAATAGVIDRFVAEAGDAGVAAVEAVRAAAN
jgi:C4-dicarboxylate-binding protein DctP